ncbi:MULTISPECIES: DNA-directed RNA polymerase subunit omega [Brevibacillus]|uniref:DNA-directed RNA polymerase subunit omega n=1 Tax=Brevibacillus brevis (strain 47 / JCM 6285 / NBRC 100599) TaxID=358681 RepID=RPOZ_BREBN|nr:MULTISPECIES: DNA-directed RNA polymerase subunit omega [Bacillales]C0ZG01.1 RecName: Full=DNA-directed RNA polymerase subunit omega; Short=RNAP omega subunit; AltName: Full=RNA polymerase omega subunit; AltName: Full=Transcriptase subunit omega [Brevibacillus brevis NBRC 100599]MED1918217.1 DNA-directed RNA polymerase subunit omega [Bacillus thuringiensis]EJL21619.1 DNA-directed RNA polymerase, omega subunit [Brevibacillus sp. BC25]MBH0333395.1 DNA-directed RNA polymerase subunit omega [Bre
MLYPSIDELTEKAESKYILVTVASKRARQLRENSEVQVVRPKSKKFVGLALEEFISDELVHEFLDGRK